MKKGLIWLLVAALLLPQLGVLAAASRSLQTIEMGDEEFSKLSAYFDQAAIAAWQAQQPGTPLNTEEDGLGAIIYYLKDQEGLISLKADLYQVPALKLSLEEAPEGSVNWLSHVDARLRRDSAQPSGFAVDSLSFSPPYQASHYDVHENAAAGYEVMLPDTFAWPSNPDNWDKLLLTSQDGKASIQIEVSRDGGETPEESRARMQAEHAAIVIEAPSLYSPEVVGAAPGIGLITVSAPNALYRLRLSYPPELEAEYQLVFQFLRNSFVISEIAVG